MSSTQSPSVPPRGRDKDRTVTGNEISTLLGALEDEDCRMILEATSEKALTTGELCEQCNLSSSTAYRKVDELQEAGLIEESIRLCSSGSHTSEYRVAVTNLAITLDGGCELSIQRREPNSFVSAD